MKLENSPTDSYQSKSIFNRLFLFLMNYLFSLIVFFFLTTFSYPSLFFFHHAKSENSAVSTLEKSNLLTEIQLADSAVEKKQYEFALKSYRSIVHRVPLSNLAPVAQWKLAELLLKMHQEQMAFKAYQFLLEKYPDNTHFESAVAQEIIIANSFLQGKRVKIFGIPTIPSMEKAVEMYTSILKVAPYSKYASIVQFNLGLAFEKQRKVTEAIDAYQKVLDKYPTSSTCDDAQYQIAYVNQCLGIGDHSQDIAACQTSENYYQDFLVQYPNSEKSQQAAENLKKMVACEARDIFRIARFYDESKNFKAAGLYYNDLIRRFPQSAEAEKSKQRLEIFRTLYGDDILNIGQERPENGKNAIQKHHLDMQVETSSLPNVIGPTKSQIIREEKEPTKRPLEMRTRLEDMTPIDQKNIFQNSTP